MNADVIEVRLKKGALSFDGRVTEAFGFNSEKERVHISLLEKLQVRALGGRAMISVIGTGNSTFIVTSKIADEETARLDEWIEAIRAAAPADAEVKT